MDEDTKELNYSTKESSIADHAANSYLGFLFSLILNTLDY